MTTRTYVGMFLVALATLAYEILLTRIFSVTMWYHFAFLAVSIAMFGMTAGALLVGLKPNLFPAEGVFRQLSVTSLMFAVTCTTSFLIHLQIPFDMSARAANIAMLVFSYVIIAVPFVCSGICVTLLLTRFPQRVGRLYAADLAGAALGCLVLVGLLSVTSGPGAVLVVSAVGAVAAALFSIGMINSRTFRGALALAAIFGVGSIAEAIAVSRNSPLFRIRYVKGATEERPLYERWNSFSRIRVHGDPEKPSWPYGPGINPARISKLTRQLTLDIDSNAATPLTAFSGDFREIEFLKNDISNVAHYLRRNAEVLVVGVGGGRDVLSALAFNQQEVTGVELNGNILRALTGAFGDYTGHLGRHPRVTLINDEARNYVARSNSRFDILQISLIDTWAATAAGAYILAENTLYTVEAFSTFFDHLAPHGVLSITRWYNPKTPYETYRLVSVAAEALRKNGVATPGENLAVVTWYRPNSIGLDGMSTLLASTQAFSADDRQEIAKVCRDLGFSVLVNGVDSPDHVLEELLRPERPTRLYETFPVRIDPPTDDQPFFFHLLRFRDAWNTRMWEQGIVSFNYKAISTIAVLLGIVTVLTGLCLASPLAVRGCIFSLRGTGAPALYFSAIGFGFMLIEISQMQRLSVFLGHPTYSLVVVLFTILLFAGAGSYLVRSDCPSPRRRMIIVWSATALGLGACGAGTPSVVSALRGNVTPIRIGAAVLLTAPLGLVLGLCFPLGMSVVKNRAAGVRAWLWGINGACSVTASVLAIVVSLAYGIAACFWAGTACYAVAAVALWFTEKSSVSRTELHGDEIPEQC